MTDTNTIKKTESPRIPSQLFKRSTTRTIRKLESKLPHYFQTYSDLYGECLHMVDNYCSMCLLIENKLYKDELNDNKNVFSTFDKMVWNTTNAMLLQIELFANMHRLLIQSQTYAIKSLNVFSFHLLEGLDPQNSDTPEEST